ncbi:MAG: hypothetical protein KAW92_10950 [Candidatus Cloacimonetes bacterium]|nr:hypothetical protein [Candidatus Cloacimonadota bacterium]
MEKKLSKVVAAPGISALVDIGNRGLQITQFKPVDLSKLFTEEEIQTSKSLKESMRMGWIVPYVGQKLPKKNPSKIVIPNMEIKRGSDSVSAKIVERKKEGKKSEYDYEVNIPKKVQKAIEDSQDKRKQEQLEEKEELLKLQKEELETDRAIKKGKVDIPEVKTIRVDGKEVPVEKFKAPKRGKKKVEENEIKVDVQKEVEDKKSKKEE